MDSGGAGLAVLLAEMKQRGGLSYEQLAHKTHLGRSTVHRYCTGRGVPATFGPVEAIAVACGAGRAELAKLYRLWEQADRARVPSTVDTADAVVTEPVAVAPGGVRRRPRLGVLVVVVLVVIVLAGDGFTAPEEAPPAHAPVTVTAPMWTKTPRAVVPEFVGVTTNTDTGLMPSFPVGSVRFWDTDTRWQQLQPEPGRFDWDTLDKMVGGAAEAGLPMLFTFGGTPAWASPASPRSAYGDGSRTGPPTDLGDWQRFVHAVVHRFHGRIGAYELWDMANHRYFFSGSAADMVEMTRIASQEIRAGDPAATVVCPSMGELWDQAAMDWLADFAQRGGYDYCDAAAVKLSPRNAADPPETMLPLAHRIAVTMQRAGTSLKMWSTGTAYDVPAQHPLDADLGAEYAVRFFLTGLYAQYQRMYFYSWGNASSVPIVLQPAGGPPTKAARQVARLHDWLADSRITSCGQGRAAGLPDQLWQCRFDHDGDTFLIWWTVDTSVQVPLPEGTTSVEHLDGTSAPAEPSIVVTGSPVLLRMG